MELGAIWNLHWNLDCVIWNFYRFWNLELRILIHDDGDLYNSNTGAGGYFRLLHQARQEAAAARKSRLAAPPADTYEGLRSTCLCVTPGQLKLAIPNNETLVYGVVIDWNMEDTVVTLVAFITGAANMYLSTGGGISGGGKNPTVGEAASELVTLAQGYIYRAAPVSAFELPPDGCVRFYLLTNHNKLAAQEQLAYFDDGTSPWLPVFVKANEVITEMHAGLN